jgi:hypothetical protein
MGWKPSSARTVMVRLAGPAEPGTHVYKNQAHPNACVLLPPQFKPTECTRKAKPGDTVHVHYTVSCNIGSNITTNTCCWPALDAHHLLVTACRKQQQSLDHGSDLRTSSGVVMVCVRSCCAIYTIASGFPLRLIPR